ncbi:MAG: beta-hydroxyacyl-ACP dehydratase [Limnochordaceae bacterium]|nr:beta-hydroxyacyl-ACP dehydratase [Limnochordaceae bacterium]
MGEAVPAAAVEVTSILPHRPPFLWVDRIVQVEPGKRAVGIKLITEDEPLLAGGRPSVQTGGHGVSCQRGASGEFPQMLLVEAMAQVAGVALLAGAGDRQRAGLLPLFASLSRVEFGRPPHVGERVEIEAQVLQLRSTTGRVQGWCRIGGEQVACGTLLFAFRSL